MADAITIPSPSVFLRASPPPPPDKPKEKQPPQAKHARKASATATTKKATPRKVSNADGPPKPKQSKSRNGCVTCKAKRLKCDEEKPGCQQCAKRSVECGGYKKDFKWRPFEETNVKANIDKQKRVSPPRQTSAGISEPTSPREEGAPLVRRSSNERSLPAKRDGYTSTGNGDENELPIIQLPQRPAPHNISQDSPPIENEPILTNPDIPGAVPPPDASTDIPDREPHASIPITGLSPQTLQHIPNNVTTSSSVALPSPTLTELLLPFTNEDHANGDFVSFDLPDDFHLPLPDYPLLDPLLDEQALLDDEVEEILRSNGPAEDLQQIWASRYHTSPSSRSSASDELVRSWNGPINYLYSQPFFSQDSPEMLTIRFDKLTCGILSVMDGPTENPWRSLIWPLAQESQALYHAILAMTAFHSSTDVPSLRLIGHEHKSASIRYIQEGIRDNSMSDQKAIATALALGFSESWDQHTATGNTHIKGAQALVKRALGDHQRNPLDDDELARLKFLCNAWVYMDVIARLTSVDSDDSNDFDNTFMFAADSPEMVMGGSGPPGFGIDFGMPIDARLDPLMGCANTLFPLIGRVANLVRKVCRSQTNSPAVISQANDLKIALETWEPPAFIEPPEDPTSQVQHALQTAEAYRWATLLHLHQSVPELPSLSSAELAQKVLTYLATVPPASRTVIVQIYPLMVAGCEASTAEDRQWVRDRWTSMAVRMRIGVIDKCATVTEEVWRRKVTYEAQPTTQRKLVATADLQPVRQRGAPLKRTHTGSSSFQNSDPGRKGMVFSWADGGEGEPGAEQTPRLSRRGAPNNTIGKMDMAYTVRGHLHWVGVMWDWGWEVLLG